MVCGNSKLHVFRGSQVLIKSKDQTLYQDFIEKGEVPDTNAEGMEESRNMYGYLGKSNNVKLFVSKLIRLQEEDILVMSSWGFWEKVSSIEMLDALGGEVKTADEYLEEIQDLFLSKQSGGDINNYTIATVFVNKLYVEKKKRFNKKVITIILIIVILIIFLIIYFMMVSANNKRRVTINTIKEYIAAGDTYIGDNNFERALVEYNKTDDSVKLLVQNLGKKGLENKKIKEDLAIRKRTVELIIDAQSYLTNKNYESAKNNYAKSLEESKKDVDFYDLIETDKINEQIAKTSDYEYMDSLLDLALSQEELEDYIGAISNYEQARIIARKYKDSDIDKDIKLSIDELNSKIKSMDAEQARLVEEEEQKLDNEQKEKEQEELDAKILSAQSFELEGDTALAEGNFDSASDYYNEAMSIYKQTNSIESAMSVTQKLILLKDYIREKELTDKNEIAASYFELAFSYEEKGELDKAMEHYNFAKDIYSSTSNIEEIKNINTVISSLKDKIDSNDKEQQDDKE
jgi:tetratricopeptide (TPR) repeat protein